ncbi:PEGA domain-containing protein [Methanospirillum stamsii]|uniref:PEGA domain-containing protein n=1 Tax=Methanospirillum stamsii TaxID=1277351 RepID=A0A2V2NBW1_9EURY|nr:PEGA domain-containing protein [Methanospirillum stamsii]PWR75106.1 hypothetical protein DLD82_06475 [Methanospirillum stamsii]
MKQIFHIIGFFICIGILAGLACAQNPGDGGQMNMMGMQDYGAAEPFYPTNIPLVEENSETGREMIQIGPGSGPVQIPVSPDNQEISVSPSNNPPISIGNNEIVGSYQDPGTAEPYYPSNPPSPAPYPTGNPVVITPVSPQDPGTAEPYYPIYTPAPEPTPTQQPRVYYPEPRYQEPSVVYHYYDHRDRDYDDRYYYDKKYYRPSYYDPDDYDCRYSSYYYVDGVLKIASTPHQAEIYVDNSFRGYTPYSGYRTLENIRPGTYTIRLKYSGYYDYYEDVYVSRGRTVYIDADMVRIGETYSKSGSISVQSEPSGAGVYLDNEYRGVSPVVLSTVSAGTHSLLVRKEGYTDYVCKVDISQKQAVSISAVLSPAPPLTQVITPNPTQPPQPEPTRAGLSGGILCIALLIGGILVLKSRPN